jgi:HlyD family secretion protein
MEGILFPKGVVEGHEGLKEYQGRGGYEALTKALKGSPDDVIKIISDAGLRGHGGAGFPTGKKWQFTREAAELPRYLVMNGGEDEPGSKKDRVLMENLPHLTIEGVVLASFAIGASKAYLYINANYDVATKSINDALAEAKAQGYWGANVLGSEFSLDIEIIAAPHNYVAGEDTAALEVIEGKKPWPRQKPQPSLVPRPQPPIGIQAATARKGPITRLVTAAGKLQAATEVKLSSNITGDLLSLTVKEGDLVKRGQALGTIDSRRYAAQVSQQDAARASAAADLRTQNVALAQAEQELARVERLSGSGNASPAEIDKARSDVAAARARAEAAQSRIDQADATLREARHYYSLATLTAPIDGVVTKREKQVGERVRGSELSEDVIMIISTLSQMEVKVEVGEQEVVFVKEGDHADIEIDAFPERKFPAAVVEVARNATVKNQGTEGEVTTFFVRLALTEPVPGALPGMSAQASVSTDTRDEAIVVPIQAVTVRSEREVSGGPKPEGPPQPEAGNGPGGPPAPGKKPKREPMQKVVFVIEGGVAKLRAVETGLASENEIEIVSGLKEGDKVVEGPYRVLSRELADGKPVSEEPLGGKGKGNGRPGAKG